MRINVKLSKEITDLPVIKWDNGKIFDSLNSASFYLSESFRLPRREYKNPNTANEAKMGLIPDDLWLMIYGFLDTAALLQLKLSSSKLADLTNADHIREKLFRAKQNKQFSIKLSPPSSETKKIPNQMLTHLPQLLRQPQTIPQIRIPPTEPDLYNNDEPGKGFVLRK